MRIAPIPCESAKPPPQRWASGLTPFDAALGGGLAYGCLHEIYAAETADAPSATGFGLALAAGMSQNATVLWLRMRRAVGMGGVAQANGWAELGGAPGHALLAVVPDAMALLRAGLDALRCGALGAVMIEGWGAMRELDLTASRRLALAAEKSGVPLLLLRVDAEPVPSAAHTRWQVAASPSRALPGNAPGQPVFDITLLRQRSGPAGLTMQVEWDREQRQFREAALSGAVVSVPFGRPAADAGAAWDEYGQGRAA
jgi:protein ImuA